MIAGSASVPATSRPESRHLDLVEAAPFPSGIVVHVYRPQHT